MAEILDKFDKTFSMDRDSGEDRITGSQDDDVLLSAFASWADAQDAEGRATPNGGLEEDIPLFDANDLVRDGGEGLDVLIGDGAINALRNGNAPNIEVAIESSRVTDLTNMNDLASTLGIDISNGQIDVSALTPENGWSAVEVTSGIMSYVEYTHNSGDEIDTILVAKTVLDNNNG